MEKHGMEPFFQVWMGIEYGESWYRHSPNLKRLLFYYNYIGLGIGMGMGMEKRVWSLFLGMVGYRVWRILVSAQL